LPVERLVRKALRAEEPIGRPGIRQLGIPQGAKRLEERPRSGDKQWPHSSGYCLSPGSVGWASSSSMLYVWAALEAS
jgi:hypothetical protein